MKLSLVAFFGFLALVIAQDYHGPQWQSKTGSDKDSALWTATNKNKNSQSWPSTLQLAELFIEDMNTTFDWVGDDMPTQFFFQTRPKLIHSVGSIVQARFVAKNNTLGYTGIFQGCDNVLARLSSAAQPSPPDSGLAPGIALKFLRNGQPSANLMAMYSLSGQPGVWNFFKHDLTNHVPDLFSGAPEALQLIRGVFAKASNFPVMIGTSEMASIDQNGNVVPKPVFPFRLIFHPSKNVHTLFPDAYPGVDFTSQLDSLTPQVLYDVYVVPEPGQSASYFGYLEAVSSPTTSNFGDAHMFFEHTRMENDLVYRPDWEQKCYDIMQQQQQSPTQYTYPDLPWN